MKDDLDLSTRNRIMQMLKTSGELTAKEITDQLGITGMAVRRHIANLERDSLIESTTVRLPMGRPAAVYRLAAQAEEYFPKNYHAVALDLLAELEDEAGQSMVNLLFEKRKETLYKRYAGKMADSELEHKVAALSDIQNDNGYMTTWEKTSDDAYVLTEYNCPIAQVANKYNQACACELKLFESLLGATVSRSDCLASGDRKCVYHIRRS
ncbi:helix-turn-helix transcriptional regulator [Cohnella boryungensis]|uniref:Helix-turn-helix transcriptional regulator n=1 Tax=Cohnella boryungensis TaxID=768479 RepID=A0ABV8SHX8_9BACL